MIVTDLKYALENKLVDRLDHFANMVSREKQIQDVIFCVHGKTGCLSDDTLLFGHTKTIGELYSEGYKFVETISLNKRSLIRSTSEIIPSGKKEVYEIELENGEKVLATAEHKFFINDKGRRKEIELKDMKEGDKMICYPKNFISDVYKMDSEKHKMRRRINYNHRKICRRCKNLFYVEIENAKTRCCENCRKEFRTNPPWKNPNRKYRWQWYEWENNLIKQFYPLHEREKLLALMPHRTLSAIYHQASRLKIERDKKFQYEKIKLWAKENNPKRKYNPLITFNKNSGEEICTALKLNQ
jgi:hypothetical protein